MHPAEQIAKADRISRLRPRLFALCGAYFGMLQLALHPYFDRLSDPALHWRAYAWVLNAVLILTILAMGGGLLNRSAISKLVNDEVSRLNSRRAITWGFWTAMAAAFTIYLLPVDRIPTARQSIYIIVSVATTVAMLGFAWLEHRANRDA
jgi:hypothetical protein